MKINRDQLRFDVHPSVVFQLGAELITDEIQALIELVKNSYDAGASYVKVDINTTDKPQEIEVESFFPQASGYVLIADDGCGMDFESIQKSWMILSNSSKKAMKQMGQFEGMRVPLGDKGLGRLGSQRIGSNIEILTKSRNSNVEEHLGFSWETFKSHDALGKIDVLSKERVSANLGQGTRIIVSQLSEPERWTRTGAVEEIEERLAELVSPFEGVESFDIIITINGRRLNIAQITGRMRQEADVTFALRFDGDCMSVDGRAKLRYLKPGTANKERLAAFSRGCEIDGGKRLLEFMLESKVARSFNLRRSDHSAWYADFGVSFRLADLDKMEKRESEGQVAPHNPGPFRGEIDVFDLSPERMREQSVFSAAAEYKKYVKHLAGVRVYRDGFGVKVDRDFLRLGQLSSKGLSWYGLRPGTTIGFIAISARDNPDLVETTDREAFKDTAHFRNFRLLLDRFVKFTNQVLEFLRRRTNDFCDDLLREKAGLDTVLSPEELVEKIRSELDHFPGFQSKIQNAARALSVADESLREAASRAIPSLFVSPKEFRAAETEIGEVEKALKKAADVLADIEKSFAEFNELREKYALLESHIERFNDRLAQSYDLMSLGLTTEALAHEIHHISDGIADRTAAVMKRMASDEQCGKKYLPYARHVRSAAAALRKQLGHLDPSLRYARERREVFDLNIFLGEIKEYHGERWRGRNIDFRLACSPGEVFKVTINRGKLTQIFDNLILNSESLASG